MEEYIWPSCHSRLQGKAWRDLRVHINDLKIRWFRKTDAGHISVTVKTETKYSTKIWHHYLSDEEQKRFEQSDYYKNAVLTPPSRKHNFERYRGPSTFLDDAMGDKAEYEYLRAEYRKIMNGEEEPVRLNSCTGTRSLFEKIKDSLTVTGLVEGTNGFIRLNYVHKDGHRYFRWLSPNEKEAFMKSHTKEEINKLKESCNDR